MAVLAPQNQYERRLADKANAMHDAEITADKKRRAWEEEVYRAHENGGVTYERAAQLSDKSRVRIDQVLRKMRDAKKGK